jgi:Ser/Thr protein kinase RdoA (MazF antagonist)
MSAAPQVGAETVRRALEAWGLGSSTTSLVAQRENEVHQVTCLDGRKLVLRLHRPGYRTERELQSELRWMAMLHAAGISVPQPKQSIDGRLLCEVDGRRADVLTWLDGSPLWPQHPELDDAGRVAVVAELGTTMARIHALSDSWTTEQGFERPEWGRAGLLGDSPLWGRFWEHPALTSEQQATFQRVRDVADGVLDELEGHLDTGLIHGDLVRENVLVSSGTSGRQLHIIDFDDSAVGYRLFDLASTIHTLRAEPDNARLRRELLSGYRSVRTVDTDELELFEVVRACTYVGWVIDRLGEPGGPERSRRYIAVALALARHYLAGRG